MGGGGGMKEKRKRIPLHKFSLEFLSAFIMVAGKNARYHNIVIALRHTDEVGHYILIVYQLLTIGLEVKRLIDENN